MCAASPGVVTLCFYNGVLSVCVGRPDGGQASTEATSAPVGMVELVDHLTGCVRYYIIVYSTISSSQTLARLQG